MFHPTIVFMTAMSLGISCLAQAPPRSPDVEAQRAAMKKLSFLIGRWAGEASLLRAPNQYVDLSQTEEAQFKLDGLVLMIEGVGHTKSDGKPALQGLGLISFDDESGTYHMRAFNNGRWLESEIKLAAEGNGMKWGFTLGEVKTNSVMRLNEKAEWTEHAELTVGTRPPQKLLELTVRRVP